VLVQGGLRRYGG
ncbi:hypothetical protein EC07798_1101, partial [Escherichia coli 07798]